MPRYTSSQQPIPIGPRPVPKSSLYDYLRLISDVLRNADLGITSVTFAGENTVSVNYSRKEPIILDITDSTRLDILKNIVVWLYEEG